MNGIKTNSDVSSEAFVSEGVKVAKSGFLGRLSYWVTLAAIFLLPIAFIPSANIHFSFTKQLIFATAVLFIFATWVLSRLKDGTFEFPVSPIVFTGGVVTLVMFFASIFSKSVSTSLLGQGFETGTFLSIFIGFLTVFIVPLYFKSKDKIFTAYLALMASFVLVAIFEIVRFLAGPAVLSFGFFTDITSNTVGQWNDLGVFFGFAAVLSWVTVEFFELGQVSKILTFIVLALSIFFLAVISFPVIWYALALIAIILVVYLVAAKKRASPEQMTDGSLSIRRLPVVSITLGVIALIMLFPIWQPDPAQSGKSIRTSVGNIIGTKLANKFNINQIDVRPSWSSTITVAKETLKTEPLLGAGPNRFATRWWQHKDPSVNETIFWGTDFNFGIGAIPTYIVTSGILGSLAWLAFIVLFLYTGFRSMFTPVHDKTDRYLITMSFLGALFLWIFNAVYAPGNVISALTYITTGLFVASLASAGLSRIKRGEYTGRPRLSFISVLALIFVLIVAVTAEYFVIQRYAAYVSFQKGVAAANNNDADKAEKEINRAAAMSRNDLFYRALTELGMIRINALLQTPAEDTTADAIRAKFQTVLGNTLNSANEAIKIDGTNYANWLTRGRVYELIVPLKIQGAYEAAKSTYEEALKTNPHNPAIYLMLARLEYTNGNNDKALDYVAEALKEKKNYTDAVYLQAQIQITVGNIKEAIKSVEAASILAPQDPTVLFQLGFLRFNNKDYKGAVTALERAVELNPIYANAKYFLGLSYQKLGRQSDAIKQFTDLKSTNADNQEVGLILKNLQAGRDPFANATDKAPEKRTTPPLTETKAAPKETPAQ